MKITRLEDIDRKKHEEKTDKITEDINRVMDGVFKKPKKNENSFIRKIGKISLVVLLLMIIINLVLGNVWLLKFFWSDLF
jgi:Fe2+ transport system protein B